MSEHELILKLKKALMDATAQPVCCEQGMYDGEGISCCGNPTAEWPPEIVELLIEADEFLERQQQAGGSSE